MLLTIDIGNTQVTVGLYDNKKLINIFRLDTDRNRTSDTYSSEIHNILSINGIQIKKIKSSIIGSVVPSLTDILKQAVLKSCKTNSMLLSECSNKGINIDIDNPKTLGDDLLAGAVGAVNMFNFPAIIFDLGTATTISVIDKTPALIGGAIMPGYKLSLCALVKHCDLINDISSHTPSSVIGKNTESCIISGLVYSTASMIDGMCERIEEELGCSCHIIATGGLAESVLPYCKRKDIVLSKELVLEGLRILYEINN